MRRPRLAALAAALAPAALHAQDMAGMPGMAHDRPPAATPAPPPAPTAGPPIDHSMAGMAMAEPGSGMPGMAMMGGALGGYAMTRDASGTGWQPDSAPMIGIMGHVGGWSTMIDGFATLIYDRQGGLRGGDKAFSTSMLMGMAQRPAGGGTLTLRGMISLDPLMGRAGYPLLLATGETADGRTGLVDRQHPHDLLMEVAAEYSRPLGGGVSGFVYAGLPGEPALGPVTYMHRLSGMANPEAPIAHHWLDATHVTFGVVTAGLAWRGVKLEGSLFTGREPDQDRWDIDRPRFDSWSLRATWNPGPDWSMQVSHGFLKSPEQLEPEQDVRRTTASLTYNRPLGRHGRVWQTTAAWGRNNPRGGPHPHATDAWLVDSAIDLGANTLFARVESVAKDELFDGDPVLGGRVFTVGKASLGGYHSVPIGKLALDLGALASAYRLPAAIRPAYGGNPVSVMLFTQLRVGRH